MMDVRKMKSQNTPQENELENRGWFVTATRRGKACVLSLRGHLAMSGDICPWEGKILGYHWWESKVAPTYRNHNLEQETGINHWKTSRITQIMGSHVWEPSGQFTMGNVRPYNDWDTLSRQGKNPPSLEIPGLGSDHQPVTLVVWPLWASGFSLKTHGGNDTCPGCYVNEWDNFAEDINMRQEK